MVSKHVFAVLTAEQVSQALAEYVLRHKKVLACGPVLYSALPMELPGGMCHVRVEIEIPPVSQVE